MKYRNKKQRPVLFHWKTLKVIEYYQSNFQSFFIHCNTCKYYSIPIVSQRFYFDNQTLIGSLRFLNL